MAEKPAPKINVVVTFAAADRPYHHTYGPQITVATVLEDVLKDFGVVVDGATRYYLLHDGTEVAPSSTVGEAAGHTHDLRLGLRTETIQG